MTGTRGERDFNGLGCRVRDKLMGWLLSRDDRWQITSPRGFGFPARPPEVSGVYLRNTRMVRAQTTTALNHRTD